MKRLLTLLLAALLLCALCVPVLAAEAEIIEEETVVVEEEEPAADGQPSFQCWFEGSKLYWDEVPGANGYEIYITYENGSNGAVRVPEIAVSENYDFIIPFSAMPFDLDNWIRQSHPEEDNQTIAVHVVAWFVRQSGSIDRLGYSEYITYEYDAGFTYPMPVSWWDGTTIRWLMPDLDSLGLEANEVFVSVTLDENSSVLASTNYSDIWRLSNAGTSWDVSKYVEMPGREYSYTLIFQRLNGASASKRYRSERVQGSNLQAGYCTPGFEPIPIDRQHFPDAAFRFYLSRDVDKDGSGALSPDEIAAAKFLDLSGDEELYDVEGIRYLTALEELNVDECGLTWLDVGSNNCLRSLSCSANGIDTLYVGNCTDLEEIDCSENELDELELVDNVNLVRLVMDQNRFTSLDISNCPKLRHLCCNGNRLTELDISRNPLLLAAVQAGAHTTDFGNTMYYLKAGAGDPVITAVRENGKTVKVTALLVTDPGVKLITEAPVETKPTVKLSDDAKTARATDFAGLYARVALVLDNGGVSGLYVTQAAINTNGEIVIPSFQVPGLRVKGVNIALVPTISDIQKPNPVIKATDFKML